MNVTNVTAGAESFTCNAYLAAGDRTALVDAGAMEGVVDVVGDRVDDLDAVVENAIEHHDGTPTVEVAVEPVDDRWVDIVVVDDGPGIPEREQRVIGGETAVTQLDHGTGLGLWVARWVLESVDGRLLFGDADDGTVVRLRLQRAEASA